MIAYPDGIDAQVGDVVVLAHGAHTGTVTHIIESAAEVVAWGLAGPGLMVDTSYGGAVFHPQHSMTDGEIVFVSRASA